MLAELLTKWAQLEPDRCEQVDAENFRLRAGQDCCEWPIAICEVTSFDLSILQVDLQAEIAARNLRCKLENHSDGWLATLMAADPALTERSGASDPAVAVALLKVYVAWLEREVAA